MEAQFVVRRTKPANLSRLDSQGADHMQNQHSLTHWPAPVWRSPSAAPFGLTAGWVAAGSFWAELIKAGMAAFDVSQWRPLPAASQSAPRYGLRRQSGRFVVADTISGAVIYTPPDFILATEEDEFTPLLAILNSGGERIEAVLAYEAKAARCEDKNLYLQRYTPLRSLGVVPQQA